MTGECAGRPISAGVEASARETAGPYGKCHAAGQTNPAAPTPPPMTSASTPATKNLKVRTN